MSSQLINLQQKFSFEAKSAFDRLLTQTLWDTHPVSFYHSASQEIIHLMKYYLRKIGKPHEHANVDDYIGLKWVVNGVEKINYEEEMREGGSGADSESVHEICSYKAENGEKWNVTITSRKADKTKHKDTCEPLLKHFLADIHKLAGAYHKIDSRHYNFSSLVHSGYSNLSGVVRNLTDTTNAVFLQLTEEAIESRVMLYCAKSPNKDIHNGFLFYVDFPKANKGEASGIEREDVFSLLQDDFVSSMVSGTSDMRLYKQELSAQLKPIRKYIDKKIECVSGKLSEGIESIKTEFLIHPDSFLTNHLQGSSTCCPVPICYQPKDNGLAGKVAKKGITFVAQTLGDVKELNIEKIVGTPGSEAYALMRFIEQGIDVNPHRRAIVTPLYGKGQLIGVLYATKDIDKDNSNFITPTQVEIFESIAHKVGNILQELRDYEFFRHLINVKTTAERAGENGTALVKKIVREMADKMSLVMNVHGTQFTEFEATEGGHVSALSKDYTKITFEHKDDDLKLYLPLLKHTKVYQIAMTMDDDHQEIFDLHREKLELFFNYCWGLTGYIAPQASSTNQSRVVIHEG